MKHMKLFEELFDNKMGKTFWGDTGAGVLPFCMEKSPTDNEPDRLIPMFMVALRGPEANEPGTWGVWGGKIEKGENPKTAALREFREETDYRGKMTMYPAYVFKTEGFVYHNFIGHLPKRFVPILDWETADYDWVTLAEMSKLKLHFGLATLLEHGWEDIKNATDKHK